MSEGPMSEAALSAAIKRAFAHQIDKIVEAEIEAAIAKVRERITEQRAAVVMTVLRLFDVERDASRIIITVKDATV